MAGLSLDKVTREFFDLKFRCAFMERRGDSFQDFFSSIMELRHPADFQRVRPWGSAGDWKNDGYLRSSRTLFQCYAPNELKVADCLTKIDAEFASATPHWKGSNSKDVSQNFDTRNEIPNRWCSS